MSWVAWGSREITRVRRVVSGHFEETMLPASISVLERAAATALILKQDNSTSPSMSLKLFQAAAPARELRVFVSESVLRVVPLKPEALCLIQR